MLNRAIGLLALVLVAAALATCQQQRINRAQSHLAEARADLAASASLLRTIKARLDLARSEAKVITEYVDRVQVVRERGATIIKEVPVYVTAQADASCPVTAGFVRVHDAAAEGASLDGAPTDPDAPAPGVALSTVADTVVSNYTACHANAEQLIALQAYVRELQAAQRDTATSDQ